MVDIINILLSRRRIIAKNLTSIKNRPDFLRLFKCVKLYSARHRRF